MPDGVDFLISLEPAQEDHHQEEYRGIPGHDHEVDEPLLLVGALAEPLLGDDVEDQFFGLVPVILERNLEGQIPHHKPEAAKDVAEEEDGKDRRHDEVGDLDVFRRPE